MLGTLRPQAPNQLVGLGPMLRKGVVGFRKIAVLDARKTHLGGGCWLLHASWRAARRGRDGRVAGIRNVSVRSGPV
jgi:hypothetical protein